LSASVKAVVHLSKIAYFDGIKGLSISSL
jgi:hypothetical protein